MATLDHIGLNRYIYMSASSDTMTLGSHTVSDISNSSGNSILGGVSSGNGDGRTPGAVQGRCAYPGWLASDQSGGRCVDRSAL